MSSDRHPIACSHCALVMAAPGPRPVGTQLRCARCGHRLDRCPVRARLRAQRVLAFAVAAVVLYPFAVTLDVMTISRLGNRHATSILGGIRDLFASEHAVLALVVLVCSVLVPLAKLAGLILLSLDQLGLSPAMRRGTWHFLEITGRWGMLDVLLVAGLVAAVKLGDLVRIDAGPGVLVFAAVVACSLIASANFDSQRIWSPLARGPRAATAVPADSAREDATR